jgi:hypothetical protein
VDLLDFAIHLGRELQKRGRAMEYPDFDSARRMARIQSRDKRVCYWVLPLLPASALDTVDYILRLWVVDDTATRVAPYAKEQQPDWASWIVGIEYRPC